MSAQTDIRFAVNGRAFAFKMLYDGNECDRNMITEIRKHGVCEPEVVQLMVRAVRPGDLVVDAGANMGYFTLLLSDLVGSEGKVLAFEPGENNLWKLEANLRLNKIRNVTICTSPLWHGVGMIDFFMCSDGGANSVVKTNNSLGITKLQTTTLHDQLESVPRLMKLDIEGAEHAALRGYEQFPDVRCPYIVSEMNEPYLEAAGSSQDKLRGYMKEQGYDTFLLHADGKFPSLLPPSVRIRPEFLNTNVLFSTMDDVVEAWPEVFV